MPSGGNGSHLDMLHQSPYSMGICSQSENKFWLFDNNGKEIVYYDFANDHGPGNSDHSDGIIRRYSGMGLAGDPNNEIPSHLVLQKETGMLFIVDTHNDRILRMNTNTGTFVSNLAPYEPTAEYSTWSGASFNVFADSGLVTPSGIDLVENRIIVSDYATGDIIIYEISGSSGIEIGRIVTGTPGIMGVKIGPEGKIWYVNFLTNQVIRIDGLSVGIKDHNADGFVVFPNPASSGINVRLNGDGADNKLNVYDSKGALVLIRNISKGQKEISLDVSGFTPGIYTLSMINTSNVVVRKFVKQ